MKRSGLILISLPLALALASGAFAKLPPPSDEAKAKAAEAAAKAAWTAKHTAFQTCQAQERAAAHYFAEMKQAGKEVRPPLPTPACEDPGPFAAAAPAKS